MLSDRLAELTRRKMMQMAGMGVFGASASGWLAPLAAHAATPANAPKRAKRCILLWMDGGPSHKDTLDLKPGSDGAGDFKPIRTSAPGVEISENFERLSKLMHLGSVVRSMSTKEGAHARAKYNLHTGYREGQGGIAYPSIGAIASHEVGRADVALPNFVTIGNRSYGSAYLGPRHQPIVIGDPAKGVEDLKPLVAEGQFAKRVGLLQEMETAFYRQQGDETIQDHKTNYQRAVKLMQSKEAKAFDLSLEPSASRSAYGTGKFADGVLMARRLVEAGVPFVEVSLGGWDTHNDNTERVKKNSQQVDLAVSALLTDLKARGLLDSTLVIWMGEFGRTPKINTRGPVPGRDHYPRAWSLAMWGGGIRSGIAVGKTDKNGAAVEGKPTSAIDFMATVCTAMGIEPGKSFETPSGRPIRLVEKGAEPIAELVG